MQAIRTVQIYGAWESWFVRCQLLGHGSWLLQLWDVLEGRKLFKEVDPVQIEEYDELGHLAHICALLGAPPKDLLDRGARTERFFELDCAEPCPCFPSQSLILEQEPSKAHRLIWQYSILTM